MSIALKLVRSDGSLGSNRFLGKSGMWRITGSSYGGHRSVLYAVDRFKNENTNKRISIVRYKLARMEAKGLIQAITPFNISGMDV